jgi:NADPH-dependent 2,4-dienoyl-CoA reductase/sulfur reductase-like enzyme
LPIAASALVVFAERTSNDLMLQTTTFSPQKPQILVMASKQKYVVVGAGPVGSLAALYAAQRGHEVEVYELRSGE